MNGSTLLHPARQSSNSSASLRLAPAQQKWTRRKTLVFCVTSSSLLWIALILGTLATL